MGILSLLGWADACGEPAYYRPLREEDFVAAVVQLRQAITQDDGHAMGLYASLLALGRGVEADPVEACAWFRQSAVRGDRFGQLSFGLCLVIGFGVAADWIEASLWIYRAARAGMREAKEVLRDLVEFDPALLDQHFSREEYFALVAGLPRTETLQ